MRSTLQMFGGVGGGSVGRQNGKNSKRYSSLVASTESLSRQLTGNSTDRQFVNPSISLSSDDGQGAVDNGFNRSMRIPDIVINADTDFQAGSGSGKSEESKKMPKRVKVSETNKQTKYPQIQYISSYKYSIILSMFFC